MIDRLANALAGTRGRVVAIAASHGGTAAAAGITARLEADGFQPLRVVAVPELRDLPLAALGPLLAEAPGADAASRLHAFYTALAPKRVRALLVVEGAEHLDDASAGAIHQLVRTSGLRVLAVADGRLPAALERLAGGALLRIELADLAEQHSLGGRLDEADAAFDAALTSSDGETLARAAELAAMHWAIRRHDMTRADVVLTAAIGRVDDPPTQARLATTRAEIRFMTSGSAVPAEASPPAPETRLPVAADPRELVFRMHAGIYTGAIADARDAIAAARPIVAALAGDDPRPFAQIVEFCAFLVDVVDGRVTEAAAAAHAQRAALGDEADAMWDYAVALPRYLAGDLLGASRAAEHGAARLAERDYINAYGPTAALHATAAATAGRTD
ncbi:MAG: hypothetical protein J7480_04055, partial [Microbacteriaceae bacterium]|nr:hypothetical protein [Microbacteriaceae bacterium]